MDNRVSVIVPLFNARNTIRQCIESILEQASLPLEVIVVDNGSTDDSVKLVEGVVRQKGTHLVTILHEKKRGPSAARNHGANAAKGDILVFTDSDCVVPKDWLSKMTDKFNGPNCPDIVSGSFISMENITPLNKYTCALMVVSVGPVDKPRYYGKNHYFFGPVFATMNLSVRKECYVRLSGLDESFLNAEDIDFCARALNNGMTAIFCPDIVVYHRERNTIAGLFKQFYYYQIWAAKYLKRHFNGFWVFNIPGIKTMPKHTGLGTVFIGKTSLIMILISAVIYGCFSGNIFIIVTALLLHLLMTYFNVNKLITVSGVKLEHRRDLLYIMFYSVVKQVAEVLGKCRGSLKYGTVFL
jgi:glycosyltransferase involved in cell wall biosynthesis